MGKEELTPAERRFAEQVRLLREERGWTQSDLAKRMRNRGLGYATQTTVSRIEQGTRTVTMVEGLALSTIFERPIELLLEPNRSEKRLVSAQVSYRRGLDDYNQLVAAVKQAAISQSLAVQDLEDLEEWHSRGPELSDGLERMYDDVVRSLYFIAQLDLLEMLPEKIVEAKEELARRRARNAERISNRVRGVRVGGAEGL